MFCNTCRVHKTGTDFYASNRSHCKECIKTRVRAHRLKNHERACEYDRTRAKRPDRKARAIVQQVLARARNPEKYKARTAVGNAVRDGRLRRQPCPCGNPRAQAHHRDYSRPLDVTWLCFKCHREQEHGQVVEVDVR